jgi:hypothetical protein
MNWNDKTVIRILLFVAKMVSGEAWRKDIDQLAAHISCWAPKEPVAEEGSK